MLLYFEISILIGDQVNQSNQLKKTSNAMSVEKTTLKPDESYEVPISTFEKTTYLCACGKSKNLPFCDVSENFSYK